jgi:hypothetical protein
MLIIIDYLAKFAFEFPLKEISSITIVTILMEEIVCYFGVPYSIHSEQGSNLDNTVLGASALRLK